MKVRSKPKGSYYNGQWSEWSSSEYWKITAEKSKYIILFHLYLQIKFHCKYIYSMYTQHTIGSLQPDRRHLLAFKPPMKSIIDTLNTK